MDDLVDTWIDDAVSRSTASGCTCGCGGGFADDNDEDEALWQQLMKQKAKWTSPRTNRGNGELPAKAGSLADRVVDPGRP